MRRSVIDQIADRESVLFKQHQSRFFLQCAINLMASDYTFEEVVQILREHADQIEELDL